MEAQDLRDIIAFLEGRISLGAGEGKAVVAFTAPGREEAAAAGLDVDGLDSMMTAPWWEEMVEDILETPSFCPDEPPETVLRYARDVVKEYVWKRFPL